ncbi:MAG: hypothetical protein J0M24_19710 [Verrucomicrobia bacterium]|nr:hypothetical protein [Verrucomicrobiota bacterium]
METHDVLEFEYDFLRGGFLLGWGPRRSGELTPWCGGLLGAYLDGGGKITALESFWSDHGGLPLQGIHHRLPNPKGRYALGPDELRVGAFRLAQSHDRLSLWFGGDEVTPDPNWCRENPFPGVELWFSKEKVEAGWPTPGIGGRAPVPLLAGIALEFAVTTMKSPARFLVLSGADFK